MPLTLESPAFTQGGPIPEEYTCDGQNVSPPFSWSGTPAETRSFLLVCTDPDAPRGTFHHWAAYDIPSNWRELKAGAGAEKSQANFRQAMNDFGKTAYGGPCPPHKDKAHHYHFCLSALNTESLPTRTPIACDEIIRLARSHEIETAELVGLYQR